MKAVLFDLDGTLIDSSEGVTKSVQYALRRFGIEEENLEKLKVFIGPPLVESFAACYGFSREVSKEAVEIYRERYQKTGIYECRLYPQVKECILALREKGYLIGMASSKPEVSCRRILEHFGILEYFDDVVGATLDGRIDTKEQVLHEVMSRWSHIPKEEMCLVGDTIFDVEGAGLVGIACVGVTFGFGNLEEMKQAGIVAVCESMEELPALIDAL